MRDKYRALNDAMNRRGLEALGLHPSRAVEDGFRAAPGTSVPTNGARLSNGWR